MSNSSYNLSFLSLPFYKSHPYILPFVGDDYESSKHKKLLLIGESHYLPKGSTVHHDAAKWYNGTPVLSKEELAWCNTRGTREDCNAQFVKEVNRCLKLISASGDGWNQVAFLNYFLRPADYQEGENDKGISKLWKNYGGQDLDREFAIKNLIRVLEIIEPELFVFLSSNACTCAENVDFKKYFGGELWDWTEKRGIEYCYTAHPSRSWWNRPMPKNYAKAGGLTSREFFCKWLREKWMF